MKNAGALKSSDKNWPQQILLSPRNRPGSPAAGQHLKPRLLADMAGFALIIVGMGIITKITAIGAVGFLLMIAGGDCILNRILPAKGPGEPP